MGETWVRLAWLTNTGNVMQHGFCPSYHGGSVRRHCCRHKLTGLLEQCMTNDPQACSLCQHENREGVRNASDFESRQEHPSFEVERSFNRALTSLFPFFNGCLEQATRCFYGNGRRSFWARSRQLASMNIVHSSFQRVFSIEMPCLSLESPALHCKRRENSTSSDTKVGSRSLQQKPGDAVAFSRIDIDASSLLFFWSVKKVETALLSEGEASDMSCQDVLV